MAINVAYKVPAALLQAERDKERRQFNRQLQLQRNQQNFQREQSDINYARSLENRQFNANRQDEQQQRLWDRQDELRDDQRQYQERQQQKQWERQDELRREQVDLDAAKLQYVAQLQQQKDAEVLRTQEWQRSIVDRQNLEKKFSYSPDQKERLNEIHNAMRDLMSSRDTLTPEQFQQALWDLRGQEAAIMPNMPIVQETAEDRFNKDSFKKELNGKEILVYPDGKGGWKVELGSKDSTDLYKTMIVEASKMSLNPDGTPNKERFKQFMEMYKENSPEEQAKARKEEAEQKETLRKAAEEAEADKQKRRKHAAANLKNVNLMYSEYAGKPTNDVKSNVEQQSQSQENVVAKLKELDGEKRLQAAWTN